MEYTLVSAGDERTLIDKVNEMFEDGWETEGGVAVTTEGTLLQAMIRFDEDEDDYETGQEL